MFPLNKNIILYAVFVCLLFTVPFCKKRPALESSLFETNPQSYVLSPPVIQEASGIVAGRLNAGYLWVEEDSGHPPQLYVIGYDGKVLETVYLKGTVNRDWEDIALSGNEIYVADIGDNARNYTEYTIYHFNEPIITADTVRQVAAIRFSYPDGSHDAEALLVDSITKNIYIITKNDNPSRIYKLSYPYNSSGINSVTLLGALNYSGVVSAAISPDGKEVIVKTYTQLYYYTLGAGESIEQLLKKSYTLLPYQPEPQGEAVAFAHDNSGFFTLSEKAFATSVDLYFYKRK